ncbi:hypothetical protein SCLCIDRAFT_9939 [Scleroderma citrinum Foug A]|uniref:Uncharacterized protein n=1 Tax=Scleroderma citrinum Foug A TaxID=1036808 RepID=A0A0C3DU18_9AGAM|nr:hypothetical protein SCLCIDRAFT_9939 [Scleroderma citrinum Foug A]
MDVHDARQPPAPAMNKKPRPRAVRERSEPAAKAMKRKASEASDSNDDKSTGSRTESVTTKKPRTGKLTVRDTVHEAHTVQNTLMKPHGHNELNATVNLPHARAETHSRRVVGTDMTAGNASKPLMPPDTSAQRESGDGETNIPGTSIPGHLQVGERNGEGAGKCSGRGTRSGGGPQRGTCASSEAAVSCKRKASEYSNAEHSQKKSLPPFKPSNGPISAPLISGVWPDWQGLNTAKALSQRASATQDPVIFETPAPVAKASQSQPTNDYGTFCDQDMNFDNNTLGLTSLNTATPLPFKVMRLGTPWFAQIQAQGNEGGMQGQSVQQDGGNKRNVDQDGEGCQLLFLAKLL